MTLRTRVADRILSAAESLVGVPIGLRVRAWDGSTAGYSNVPGEVVFANRRALRHILWAPNEIGLARAYISGDLDITGPIVDVLDRPEVINRFGHHELEHVELGSMLTLFATLARLGAIGRRPLPPRTEVRTQRGARHSRTRDAEAISHHYDVGNNFYRLVLGPSMVYSCGYWRNGPGGTLEAAQRDKLDLICRKLDLAPGKRLLDVGCGWGSLAIHAAQHYGVDVVGVTLSEAQQLLAKQRVHDAQLDDRVEIRLQDYRDVDDGPFDAIASIGMSEHVGAAQMDGYAEHLAELLVPGGRLLNHAIAAIGPVAARRRWAPSFIESYIFPDGEILPLSTVAASLEKAGLEIRDTESLREHYALTLRAWVDNLQAHWAKAVELAGIEVTRTWLLYLAVCALAFHRGRVTIHQVVAIKQRADAESGMSWTRDGWSLSSAEQRLR